MKKIIHLAFSLSWLLVLAIPGCDVVKDDVLPAGPVDADLFTFAEKPVILNVTSLADGKDVQIKNLTTPKFGTFDEFVIENRRYLVYSPDQSFKGNVENIELDLFEVGTSTPLLNVKKKIGSLDGRKTNCEDLGVDGPKTAAVYDYAKIKHGETLKLDLLANDIFCGVKYNGGIVSAHTLDGALDADHDYLISLGPGRVVTFEYKPSPNFTGKVRIMYEAGINWIKDSQNVDGNVILANPEEYLEAFLAAIIEIEVVN